MGQDRIDQHIQETLIGHKTPIDSEALWQSISQTKARRIPVFYLWSGIALFALLTGAYFWGYSDASDTVDINFHEGSALNSNQVSNNEGHNKLVEYKNNATEIVELKQTSATSIKEEKISENTQEANEIGNQAGLIENSSAIDNQEYRSNQRTLGYSDANKDSKDDIPGSNAETENYIEIANSLENQVAASDLTNLNFNSSEERNLSLKSISGISSINSDLESNTALIDMWLKTTECPSFGKKKGSLFVEAYSLLDYAVNSYNSLPEFDAYLEERKATQNYKPSYRAGIQFKYLFDNGFLVKAGLEYARSREQFRYRRETIRTEIRPDQVIHVHVDMNGDTTVVLGNAPVTIIETKNWRVRNSYSSVDIPLSIGYQFDQGPWFYTAEAGIIYNLNYGFSGMLLDTTGEPVMADSYFKDKTALSYQAAFTLGYRINATWSFICRGSMRTHPGLVNSTSNVIDQSYSLIGAGVGMEYKF